MYAIHDPTSRDRSDRTLTAILPNAELSIPRVKFDVGVKSAQSRIHIDRAKKYVFALALENSITGGVHAASRDIDASETDVKVLGPPRANPEAAINGSVLKVIMKGYFPFSELAELEPVHRELPGFPQP